MNKQTHSPVFDFSEWSQLAMNDPEAFEKKREQAIESALEQLPTHRQQRMRGLQWRIDQERNLAKSPMAACIKLSDMMWENLLGEHGLVESIRNMGKSYTSQELVEADILSFPARPQ